MSRYRLQSFLFIFIAFMLGCNEYMIVGVLPDIAKEYHASLSSLGYVVTVFALVYALSTPFITSLGNHYPREKVLVTLMVIFFLGNTWTALATNYWSLIFSRVLTACTAGAIISLVLVMANFIAPLNKRAGLLSWVFAGFSIASVVGLPIGTMLAQTFNWHISFGVISIFTLLSFIALLFLIPKNTPQTPGKISAQFSLLTDKKIIYAVIFVVMVCAADYSYYTFIRPLITGPLTFSPTALNWILSFLGVCSIIGNKFAGYLADHGGVKRLPVLYLIMTLLFAALGISLHLHWLGIFVISLLCIIYSSYGATTQIMFLDIAQEKYPQSLDLASSLNSIFANIGISLGSFTASLIAGITSIDNAGYFAAIYGLIAFLCIWYTSKIYQKNRQKEV